MISMLAMTAAMWAKPAAAYIGAHPNVKVGAYSFLDDPGAKEAIWRALREPGLVAQVHSVGVAEPVKQAGMYVRAQVCEPHNCDDHNWAVYVRPATLWAVVCYHNRFLTDDTARWFVQGWLVATTAGDCGSEDMPPAAAIVELSKLK